MRQRIVRREPRENAASWQWPERMHPVLRQVYERRELDSVEDLDLALQRIAPVGSFDALEAAAELLVTHRHGRIVIVGDYDSDGATSTAMMLLCLRDLGFADVQYFVPDRFALGYGLSVAALDRLRALRPDLIVTVDNGISSVEAVAAARSSGIDVLVTDHHLPPERVPDANVIVNPNLPGASFPGWNLAGVGVAFYVLAALGRALGNSACVAAYLDLVALGTVADLVRLDRGNRILVEQGLRRIRSGVCRPGILALCELAGTRPEDVTAQTLAFQIAPRLNAAGRLDDMSLGVACLIAESPERAREQAQQLDELNRNRRDMEASMRAQAMEYVDALALEDAESKASRRILVLEHEDWHEGLVGLIASRVRERVGLPSFAFAPAGDGFKGSGRSVPGFHLRDALVEVDAFNPGLIERFGGHAMAAGLSLRADALPAFRAAIEDVAARRLDPDSLRRVIWSDGELGPEHLCLEAATALREGGPWGQGFPEPLFDGRFTIVECRWLRDVHLRMVLAAGDGRTVEAIAFNCEYSHARPGADVRVAYRLSINDYFDDSRLQLIVEHCEQID